MHARRGRPDQREGPRGVLPETPPGDAGLSLGVSVVKKITLLLMTMALAVAMVACTGAVKQGPPGEKGDKGDQGEPGTAGTPDPGDTTPGTTGTVQIRKSIDPLVFNNVEMNGKTEMDSMAKTVMLAKHFFPSGLTYTLEGHSMAEMKRFTAVIDQEADTLTVQLKKGAPYKDDKITVKATDGDSSESIEVAVRRNQKPTVVDPKYDTADPPELVPATNKQAVPVIVWIGTEDEVTVMAKDVGDSSYDPKKHIGVAIASSPGLRGAAGADTLFPDDMRSFFNDDAGDSLTLMHEALSASDSRKLMVTDGNMKVMLLGMKTTKKIMVSFVAEDSGKLKSVASVPVLEVMIDAPPKKKAGAAPIPTQVVMLGTDKPVTISSSSDSITGDELRVMFEDDWHINTSGASAADPVVPYLMISAKSGNPDVVLVKDNLENKSGKEIEDAGMFTLVGLKEGEASITVTAKESEDKERANLKQSFSMTINVSVRAPSS